MKSREMSRSIELGRDVFPLAARLHPEDPWPYFGLGQVETVTGRTEQALAAYREFAR
jgi:cytochrome c-type biogenesis protein CcmH/NrfG